MIVPVALSPIADELFQLTQDPSRQVQHLLNDKKKNLSAEGVQFVQLHCMVKLVDALLNYSVDQCQVGYILSDPTVVVVTTGSL